MRCYVLLRDIMSDCPWTVLQKPHLFWKTQSSTELNITVPTAYAMHDMHDVDHIDWPWAVHACLQLSNSRSYSLSVKKFFNDIRMTVRDFPHARAAVPL